MKTESEHIIMQESLGGSMLAYIGDAVIGLWVRNKLLSLGMTSPSLCSERSLLFVTAKAQSLAYERIRELLDSEESELFHRGRNARVSTPKSSAPGEYHRSTGFEALIGALHLNGRHERINELLSAAYSDVIGSIEATDGIK